MRKTLFPALLALALGGCAAAPVNGGYGNFVQSDALDQQKLAADAVQQLAALYAPAQMRLELQQPTPDPFGQTLVRLLRDKGYALVEFAPSAVTTPPPAPTTPGGLPLRYLLDQARDSNLYRLTLVVGTQSITRPYLEKNGGLVPAGYWTRQE
ncbi:conjugal transfer protein TrbH [Verminephrobacter aporrectodeae subsp. tuberculatae]|uniref:Conjugal transfer protein TrbH n=1 Tax=Verminephrobacter aporrectodeae subsp. tuberculatae TaxID=1110392 RepID=A0ABT3KVT0_9BURK|nr:conjugal transfer protein TrbH [Verminephrobacter aporrectodeae]MCW5321905.1 conjugal transfer protein TrbH [Verminephrobacter aporrectodeae subsp. tuberculatae]